MKAKNTKKLTYDDQFTKCQQFIRNFEDYSLEDLGVHYEQYGRKKYMIQLQRVANQESKRIQILYEDLDSFFRKEDQKEMVERFKGNTMRYIDMFSIIANDLMPKRNSPIQPQQEMKLKFQNILQEQRRDNISDNPQNNSQRERIPYQTHKDYDIAIVFGSKIQIKAISQLKSENIGSLVAVKAIVLRVSEIKPELVIATYSCDVCGCENYVNVVDTNYKPLIKCTSKKCEENRVNGKLSFLPGHSKFTSYQELRIQETPDQLKIGSIPRTFSIHVNGNLVKSASPGDIILAQGVLLPNRRAGFKHQNDLSFDCHLEALKITRQKKKYVEMSLNEEDIDKINSVRSNMTEDKLFDSLAKSIAPEIYGLEYVKKALLLLMVGGVTQVTHDMLRIRGQINIALIGDPGIAKSQLLKQISVLAPRAVYTTGKGSSGVGLTAAIVIDPNTKQLSLEAGALVLADMGVCCIDEFDKMDEYDRTAIHEVMEQQTVSIAKAGITTTLNARTSILAAANPLYGRYNRKQTPHKNINMPAALLSRFDLVFILLDTADKERDLQLARHIGMVHQKKKSPVDNVFDPTFLRNYIAMAKEYNPTMGENLHSELIKRYVAKRQQNIDLSKEGESYTTMRSLLALIRLCQARARLRFSNEISYEDVAECMELLQESQRSILSEKETTRKPKADNISAIYSIIKDMCNYKNQNQKMVEYEMIQKRVLARGYRLEDLQTTIKNYENMNVLQIQNGIVSLIE